MIHRSWITVKKGNRAPREYRAETMSYVGITFRVTSRYLREVIHGSNKINNLTPLYGLITGITDFRCPPPCRRRRNPMGTYRVSGIAYRAKRRGRAVGCPWDGRK